jgi:ABC-2 type transport system permease protein
MSLAIGGGIPIAFYVFSTMAAISDDLEFFQYFSLNTLFDGNVILNVFNIMGK